MSTPLKRSGFREITQSSVYIAGISGKLSFVTTHSEDPIRIEPLPTPEQARRPAAEIPLPPPIEVGGREGPDPTRFGDWELRGRCIDF